MNKTRDGYRPLFCSKDFYAQNQNIFRTWKARFERLSLPEKVQCWVFGLSCLRRPDDWFGGYRKSPVRPDFNPNDRSPSIDLKNIFIDTPVKIPPKLDQHLSLANIMNHLLVKALPESCQRSLCFLGTTSYPLLILNHVPKPLELLEYQLNGKRVVTFNEEYETWPHLLYNERDFLSFIIHDLIHADHFFKDNKNMQGQLGFYHLIEKIWPEQSLQQLLASSEFKTGFEYIISDMNAHPLHLLKTLHAHLSRALNSPELTQKTWNSWISIWDESILAGPTTINALQKINTQLFCHTDALELETACLQIGQKKTLEKNFNLI